MNPNQQVPVQPMPVEFDLIVSDSTKVFVDKVNDMLKKGWIFHGAMQVIANTSEWVQPMCRLELRPLALPKQDAILPVTLK